MDRVVFRLSPKAMVYVTVLIAGLLVFVWLHWRGQRQVELIVFSLITALAATLYTLTSELSLSPTRREVTGKRTWLGMPIHRIAVRVGTEDALHLTEEITQHRTGQGISVWHRLEASGELLSRTTEEPGPYILASQTWPPHRARLVSFAERAANSLGVPLEDSREFTERIEKIRGNDR
ncbi:MAG: hypothetical protein R3225_08505 [Halofilum sp. (in: g-proteobacteria)]|nr:hypothetical protein [Halofilum sp. (in: g-proteobacteria)]